MESDLGASHPLGFRAKISAEAAVRSCNLSWKSFNLWSKPLLLSSDSPEADIDP